MLYIVLHDTSVPLMSIDRTHRFCAAWDWSSAASLESTVHDMTPLLHVVDLQSVAQSFETRNSQFRDAHQEMSSPTCRTRMEGFP